MQTPVEVKVLVAQVQTDKTESHSCGTFKEDVEGDDLTLEEISIIHRL